MGNIASLYAINILGYAVAYPIMQSSLIIAALWGVYVFNEIKSKYVIITLFSFAITVMIGCGLITYGVDGNQ